VNQSCIFDTPQNLSGAVCRTVIDNDDVEFKFRLSPYNDTFTLSGNTGTLYVDGVQVAQNTNMTLNPSQLGQTGNNFLGDSQYAADPTSRRLITAVPAAVSRSTAPTLLMNRVVPRPAYV
jgi:hypothetical protein